MSATNRGAIRHPNDNYPTPITAIMPLLVLIDWSKITTILEPCSGTGNITNLLANVTKASVDTCEIASGVDYLTFTPTKKYDLIITNPPFSIAEQFIEKSLKEADCVIYLLRLNFLASQKRKAFWQKVGTPDKLAVLSERPSFTGKGTDACEYGWFIWDKKGIIKTSSFITIL